MITYSTCSCFNKDVCCRCGPFSDCSAGQREAINFLLCEPPYSTPPIIWDPVFTGTELPYSPTAYPRCPALRGKAGRGMDTGMGVGRLFPSPIFIKADIGGLVTLTSLFNEIISEVVTGSVKPG